MVGFTPQVSAAVWVGSGNSTGPIVNAAGRPEYGADLPGKTWALFMDTYLAGQPALPMATKQLITGGQNESTPTPTPRSSASTSSASRQRHHVGATLDSRPPPPSSPTVSRTHHFAHTEPELHVGRAQHLPAARRLAPAPTPAGDRMTR